jgi:hypothetical protein
MESKFIALNKDGEETEWLRNFLEDFPCWAKPVSTIHIYCDIQSVIRRCIMINLDIIPLNIFS